MAPARDPIIEAHQEWLGYAQPVGLVVSPHALKQAQAQVDRNVADEQERLRTLVEPPADAPEDAPYAVSDFVAFAIGWLDWPLDRMAGAPGGPPLPADLTRRIGDNEHVAPDLALADPDDPTRWQLLVQVLPQGQELDRPDPDRGYSASPESRMERLLRETGVIAGLIFNGVSLRLVCRPRGETPGHLTFRFAELREPAARPLVSALLMLFSKARLFSLPERQRLPALLTDSRRYQNSVSTRLAEQVQEALAELLHGFERADSATGGRLLAEPLRDDPEHVYGGLLAAMMRLVFVLYTEHQGLMPAAALYGEHYSVARLYEQLRSDRDRYADTMHERYGAWARLLALFRLIHDGASHGAVRMPPRGGRLFDPDAYPFLEGRPYRTRRVMGERYEPPRISDGTVLDVLERLLLLDGERLSYRALDVEQIGSVYEAMMGFTVRAAKGPALAVTPHHAVVALDALLAAPGRERAKRLEDETGCKLTSKATAALAQANGLDEIEAALGRRRSPLTRQRLDAGGLYLEPTDERRRSGSNYTPRALTEPIVRTTLEPVLAALGPGPRPAQILALKVCDPAMGSAAFLVEACRQLADALVEAWERHGEKPAIPPDEDAWLHARRLIAQRCLYGVDKNPHAVDLAKLSLWLVTFAREHPFTFVDHALRCGDSLVGLSREQITRFHWQPGAQLTTLDQLVRERLKATLEARAALHALGDSDDTGEKERLLGDADSALADARLLGDCVVAAFFGAEKDKLREERRARLEEKAREFVAEATARRRSELEGEVEELADGAGKLHPFHWELEFPEVFARENGGFDGIVGNPPFLGGKRISTVLGAGYRDWLSALHEESNQNSDLVAHFFRRAFSLLRRDGAFGLIATNTIAQGDTRATGLRYVLKHGGAIYRAERRYKWPGQAAVVVSVVHITRGEPRVAVELDGRPVERISAFLFHRGGDDDPRTLRDNLGIAFQGCILRGLGFTFAADDPDVTPIAEMHRLIAKDARNAERIFPYLGGEEVNDSPTHAHRRFAINFGAMSEEEARRWPDLMAIVEARVKPERMKLKDTSVDLQHKRNWWRYANDRPEMNAAIAGMDRVLVTARVSQFSSFSFLPPDRIFSEQLVVFALPHHASFTILQSRLHEIWARFFGSSMKDDPRYTPTNCFETFPFPEGWRENEMLERAGRKYYDFRAALMVRNNEGLTKTYNHFHSAHETSADIVRLRELHAAVDRAVLDAYGWTGLQPTHEFIPDFVETDDEGREVPKNLSYRWPDDLRDEILARLLKLNQEQAEAEGAGEALTSPKPRPRSRRGAGRRRPGPSSDQPSLDLPH